MGMNVAEFRSLFAYNEWANARLFNALDELTEEQFRQPITSSFSSVQNTVSHIVAAEWVWLQRWKGESLPSAPDWSTGASREQLRQALEGVQAERAEFLAQLADERLDEFVAYRNPKGDEYRNKLSDSFQHLVNHSTYHRGQAATLLRQVGVAPPATDFVLYRSEVT